MDPAKKTQAIILLIILIAIGGLVLYNKEQQNDIKQNFKPQIEGPTSPPPTSNNTIN